MKKQLREDRQYVYVQDRYGKPLMPTNPGRARQLLRRKQAVIVDYEPFTIRLTVWSEGYKQPVVLGVDTGHAHIGLCASTEKLVLLMLEMVIRTDIVENLAIRHMMKRTRRGRNTRFRKMRYMNRKSTKKKGWLPPSFRYKVDKHLGVINWITNILPISKIRVEVANFDVQKILNPNIKSLDYQHGEQEGFNNTREYVLWRDNHTCQHCKGKSGDKVLQVHHIESRKTGGNAPNNLVTLCKTCHDKHHQGDIKLNIKRGQSFKQSASVNTFKKQLIERLKTIYRNVELTYGYFTKNQRIILGLPKTHCMDAYCITGNINSILLKKQYKCKCFRRHNRSLHVIKFTKGHHRRSMLAPYWLGKNKDFTRYDKVWCNGTYGFITGSSNGRAYIKDIHGFKTAGVNSKIATSKLKRIRHAKHGCMIDRIDIQETCSDFLIEKY